MIKPIALTFAAAVALAPISTGAAETAIIGGGAAAPPEGSPGPGKGVTAPPGQGAVRVPAPELGQVPHPKAPPLSRDENNCVKTTCANSNGAGE